jgi:hypothetical protein
MRANIIHFEVITSGSSLDLRNVVVKPSHHVLTASQRNPDWHGEHQKRASLLIAHLEQVESSARGCDVEETTM